MTDTTADATPAATPGPLATTITLAVPVVDKGKTVDALTITEPVLSQYMYANRVKSRTEQTIRMISQISGIGEDAVRKLRTRDALRVQRWLQSIEAADIDEQAQPELSVGAESKTFDLLVPLADGAATITKLTLREPDLAAGIEVERFKTPGEQTAAMIAMLSDTVVPLVSKLVMRDVRRMEAWIVPFVDDSGSTEAAGAT